MWIQHDFKYIKSKKEILPSLSFTQPYTWSQSFSERYSLTYSFNHTKERCTLSYSLFHHTRYHKLVMKLNVNIIMFLLKYIKETQSLYINLNPQKMIFRNQLNYCTHVNIFLVYRSIYNQHIIVFRVDLNI